MCTPNTSQIYVYWYDKGTVEEVIKQLVQGKLGKGPWKEDAHPTD